MEVHGVRCRGEPGADELEYHAVSFVGSRKRIDKIVGDSACLLTLIFGSATVDPCPDSL